MSKIFTLAKPRPGDWNGLITIAADIERDLNRAIPYRFGVIADGQYLIRNGGSIVGASAPGGTGAPVGAGYITIASDATLTSERILGVGSPLQLTDFGAGLAAQITFQAQSANFIFVGPTSGPAAAPSFRAMVLADIPSSALGTGAASSSVFLRGDRIWASASVSSIAWTAITGTPTTIAGYGITDFNSLGDARWAALAHTHDASAIVTGTLTQARGGTGFGTYTKGDILYASTLNTLSKLALGATDGWVLTSNTTSGVPEWRSLPAGTVYAPLGASYVTVSLDGSLTSERTLGAASPLQLTDTGANGSISVSFANQTANFVLAGPTTGAAAAPSFRGLVAADIPNLDWTKITTGLPTTLAGYGITDAYTKTASDARYAPIVHTHDAADITTGVLVQARGGTGFGTYTKGDLLYASATNTLSKLALGVTDGFVLTSNTTSGLPEWRVLPAQTVYAPLGASYITVSLDPSLTSERTLGAASPLQLTDTGANGSVSVGFANQSANFIFAGPTSGAAALPTFRGLVAGDIPALDAGKITTGLMAQARLGTGSGGLGAKFLADDQTYKAVTATVAAPFTGNQDPGGFIVTAGEFGLFGPTLILSGTEEAEIDGDGELVLCG